MAIKSMRLTFLVRNNLNKDKTIKYTLSVCISVIFFLFVTGGSILNTDNTYWIINSFSIDYKQHWITWLFFQNSPLFQLPLTDNYSYGMGLSTTLAANDSIPLMALASKLMKPFFGLPNQYLGLWIFICFILQGLFSYKILEKFIDDKYILVISTIFFLIAPVFLFRLSLGHTAMFGHWIILASINMYFSSNRNLFKWLLVIVVSLLINSYISSMVLLFFIAFFFKTQVEKGFKFELMNWVYFIGICFFFIQILPIIGLDINVSKYYTGGFANYRTNINSFFDPGATNWQHATIWSSLLPDLLGSKSNFSGDYEGFAFLGIGTIALLPICIYSAMKNFRRKINRSLLPIILSAVFLFIYSLSNEISLGKEIIFEYNVPKIFKVYTESLRASGRFIWPVVYLIYILVFTISYKLITKKVLRILLTLLLALQIYDSTIPVKDLRESFSTKVYSVKPEWKLFMKNPIWNKIATKYDNVLLVMPNGWPSKQFLSISLFASQNSMNIDSGYHARFNKNKMSEYQGKVITDFLNNKFQTSSIYFFVEYSDTELDLISQKMWDKISVSHNKDDLVKEIDGFKIFAPSFFKK